MLSAQPAALDLVSRGNSDDEGDDSRSAQNIQNKSLGVFRKIGVFDVAWEVLD